MEGRGVYPNYGTFWGVVGHNPPRMTKPRGSYQVASQISAWNPSFTCHHPSPPVSVHVADPLTTANLRFVTNSDGNVDMLTLEAFAQPSGESEEPRVEFEVVYQKSEMFVEFATLYYMDLNGEWIEAESVNLRWDGKVTPVTTPLNRDIYKVQVSTTVPYFTLVQLRIEARNAVRPEEIVNGRLTNGFMLESARLFAETCVPDMATGGCL